MSRVETERIKYRHILDFVFTWRVEHKPYTREPLLNPFDVDWVGCGLQDEQPGHDQLGW